MPQTKQPDIFEKEKALIDEMSQIAQQDDFDQHDIGDDFKKLLKEYKRLLRRTKSLTKTSDNTQHKLKLVQDRLGRYVSPQLKKKILSLKEKVEIKTRRRKLTVFFSDIKDFSAITSHMESEALSELLNRYLNEMTSIVHKWGGTLDKYVGDAIMVFFGDPVFESDAKHAMQCVNMALDMRERLKQLQQGWFSEGYQEPLHCRMGIATGYCTVGNFGTSERMDYTIIGSTVNLASRLEDACDVDDILISHETWGLVRDHTICSHPEALSLKGFTQPQIAYKLLGAKDEDDQKILHLENEELGYSIKLNPSRFSKQDLLELIEKIQL